MSKLFHVSLDYPLNKENTEKPEIRMILFMAFVILGMILLFSVKLAHILNLVGIALIAAGFSLFPMIVPAE